MLTGRLFKLKERTLAIEVVESERRAVSIPAGAIIKVLSGNDDPTVDVLWESRKVEIFTCDVNMRGAEITDQSAKAQKKGRRMSDPDNERKSALTSRKSKYCA